MTEEREYSPKRFAISGVYCPSCQHKLEREAKWCEKCGFTGARTLEMFGDTPPPLLPILDVADVWSEKEQRNIKTSVAGIKKRYPQFHWRICAVALPPETGQPVFGFWLMNVCPLLAEESPEDREWTILLLIDTNNGRASVTAGYRAEVWLTDEMWNQSLVATAETFHAGHTGKAVVQFLNHAGRLLEEAWKRAQKQKSAKPDP
ncbi:MAG: zinc ribbon domain-containing protein [Armatimonadetes bacterium]|nr:zinc ribbon domain-containing protein [Akkermansiaceae bacterium]